MYGEQRFIESIECNGSLEKRVDAILYDVKIFSDDAPATDDILLLEINCDPACINRKEKNKISFNELQPMDWQLSFEFCKDVICNSNPIPTVVQTMTSIQGLGKHREKIFLILTEMYSNAVEHGILNLDSAIKEEENGFVKYYELRQSKLDELVDGNIKININHYVEDDKGIVSLTMEDDGAGFDFTNAAMSLTDNELRSGRGISLIRDLCRKCEYSKEDRKLEIEYEWELTKMLIVA